MSKSIDEQIEPSPEALHIIETAYQDMQGVLSGKKGYKLRHNLLALKIDEMVAQAEKEARKETVLHFRKVAQYEKDRGWGCGRILGETKIMAKNSWKPKLRGEDE